MGEINIPHDQQLAIAAIEASELDRLIEQAVREERSGDLHRLQLANCGTYIATKLQSFDKALARHREAKASRKREQTGDALRRAGHDLSFAVGAMKKRMEEEKKEGELFFVDDHIMPPYRFSKELNVRVSYRWRRTIDDDWTYASITFKHICDPRPDYTRPAFKRKPSAAKQEQELQNNLHQTWEHLMRGALYSVRDYFRQGGDGEKVPESYRATVDSYSRDLNNFSTQFWREQP
jgi:hypothetical protein